MPDLRLARHWLLAIHDLIAHGLWIDAETERECRKVGIDPEELRQATRERLAMIAGEMKAP